MEGLIGLAALSASVLVFIGANLLAIAFMTGGDGEGPDRPTPNPASPRSHRG